MKVRRLILVAALALIVCGVGAKQGLAYMQTTYGGVCAKLDGLPGLLQKMNLLAVGNCSINGPGKCKNPGAICTVSSPTGLSLTGICTNQPKVDCTCVPKS